MRNITKPHIEDFRLYLINEEKSGATIEKYMRDIQAFSAWLGSRWFDKMDVLTYKTELTKKYAPASVNTVLSSLNSFFTYQEWYELNAKRIATQEREKREANQRAARIRTACHHCRDFDTCSSKYRPDCAKLSHLR